MPGAMWRWTCAAIPGVRCRRVGGELWTSRMAKQQTHKTHTRGGRGAVERLKPAAPSYGGLAEHAPVGIYTADLEGRLLYANNALARILEVPDPTEMLGRSLADWCTEPRRYRDFVDSVRKVQMLRNHELQITTAAGNARHILLSATLEADGISAVVTDITDLKKAQRQLQHSRQRYALAQRAARIGSWDWNILTGELVWSEEIEPMFGFGPGQFVGTYQAFLDCIHPDDRKAVTEAVAACVEHGRSYRIEHRVVRPDGAVRWVAEAGDVIRDERGKAVRMLGVVRDITDATRTRQRQLLAFHLLDRLNRRGNEHEIIRDILAMTRQFTGFDAVGVRLRKGDDFPYYEVNGFSDGFVGSENYLCARDSVGNPIRDNRGRVILECMCGNVLMGRTDPNLPFFTEAGSFWTNSTTELLNSPQVKSIQGPLRGRCNQDGYESVALIPLRSGEQVIGLLQLNDRRRGMLDIETVRFFEVMGASVGIALARINDTEQIRRLNEELEHRVAKRTAQLSRAIERLRSQIEQRKKLEKEVLEITERDQKMIGQELHDSIGQQLTGIAFMVKVLEQKLADKMPGEAAAAARIADLVRQATDQARSLARGLDPVNLEAAGLMSALEELAAATQQLYDVPCSFECPQAVHIHDNTLATNVYRVAQEAVNNAVKHGRPKRIWITLAKSGDTCTLTVENDGLDFPADAPGGGGMGLRIMSHRAELIHGRVEVSKRRGGGTIVTCTFGVSQD